MTALEVFLQTTTLYTLAYSFTKSVQRITRGAGVFFFFLYICSVKLNTGLRSHTHAHTFHTSCIMASVLCI